MKNILCIGMANVDVSVANFTELNPTGDTTYSDEIAMFTGGDAFNTANRLNTMGVPVSFVGTVGADAAGDLLLANMKGMETAGVIRATEYRTGTGIALVSPDGQRRFIYNRGANVLTDGKNITEEMIARAGIVHTGGVMQMEAMENYLPELFDRAHRLGAQTSMDITYDSEGKWFDKIKNILPKTDYFMPSIEEAREITGRQTPEEMREFFSRYPMKMLIVKLGKEGSYVTDFKTERYFPRWQVETVDTTGAGDSFVAGVIAALLHGEDCFRATTVGNITGAVCVTARGAGGGRISYEDALTKAKTLYQI